MPERLHAIILLLIVQELLDSILLTREVGYPLANPLCMGHPLTYQSGESLDLHILIKGKMLTVPITSYYGFYPRIGFYL